MASIGILLPRSVEYPAMGIDILDGIRLHMKQLGFDCTFYTEGTGFGEDIVAVQTSAEKLLLNNDPDLFICYATSLNAETLYSFAKSSGKPILFIDAGMEIFDAPPHPLCYHLTLQGLTACLKSGEMAGEGGRKVIAASSFLDGGYRSTLAFCNAVAEKGGTIEGHYVGHYLPKEFSVAHLDLLVKNTHAQAITASFSSYLVELFMSHLAKENSIADYPPFYCSPFMADEQLLSSVPFPQATFNVVVPWATSITNEANTIFLETIHAQKKKTANIFHLLGWEAAAAAKHILESGAIENLNNWSFESPRGTVHFDAETHSAYAPLYQGKIENDGQDNCKLVIEKELEVTQELHRKIHFLRPEGEYTRWKNNYFCI